MSSTDGAPDTRRGRPTPRDVLRAAIARVPVARARDDVAPCVFHTRGSAVELRADRERMRTIHDPNGRESIIGGGVMLLRLRVVLQAAGHASRVEVLPDAADSALLARVHLAGARVPTAADRALVAALGQPSTAGLPYEGHAVPPHVLSLLLGAARVEGAWLAFIDTPPVRHAFAGLVVEASRRQEEVARLRRMWTTFADRAAEDPASAVWTPPATSAGILARVEHAPTVAVLATPGDALGDWLVAGQALARVLLTASAAGVSASYLNQPVEVPDLRPRVARLVRDAADPNVPGRRGAMPADATPQIALRLGYVTGTRPNDRPERDGGPTGHRAA
jgi:hypothetical protein